MLKLFEKPFPRGAIFKSRNQILFFGIDLVWRTPLEFMLLSSFPNKIRTTSSLALACIMPLDQGSSPTNGGGSVTRYYHNSVTGNCETFSFRGAGGNANNFETLDQCESYCKQRKAFLTIHALLVLKNFVLLYKALKKVSLDQFLKIIIDF